MAEDALDKAVKRLAELAGQTVPNMRRWVMYEANKRHVRPITFARQRLHELRTWSPMKLLNRAKSQGRLKGVDFDYALIRTKAVSRCARRGGRVIDALKKLLHKERLNNAE